MRLRNWRNQIAPASIPETPHDQPTGPNLAPSLLNQLSTEKQSNGQVTCPPPQQLSNLSTGFQLSSSYKSASPVTTASRFRFSSPSVGSAHSPSHFSLPSSRQLIKSPKLLSSPTACSMQQEFSISESLSHCSDYDDILDLDGPMAYPSRVPSLMPMASSRVSRDDGWQWLKSDWLKQIFLVTYVTNFKHRHILVVMNHQHGKSAVVRQLSFYGKKSLELILFCLLIKAILPLTITDIMSTGKTNFRK